MWYVVLNVHASTTVATSCGRVPGRSTCYWYNWQFKYKMKKIKCMRLDTPIKIIHCAPFVRIICMYIRVPVAIVHVPVVELPPCASITATGILNCATGTK